MAATFDELRVRENLDSMLVLGLEFRNETTGAFAYYVALGERYLVTPGLPSPYNALECVSGVVVSWGEIGYAGDVTGATFPVSDATVVLDPLRQMSSIIASCNTVADWLHTYELVGSRGQILQGIYDPEADDWVWGRVFSGMVASIGEMTPQGITLTLTDVSQLMGSVPPDEVNFVDFDDAPAESLGAALPILYGDFASTNPHESGYEDDSTDQYFGVGNQIWAPTVVVDMNTDSATAGPTFRIACHELHTIDTAVGMVLQEPELPYPSAPLDADWDVDNTSAYCDLTTLRDFLAYVYVRPSETNTTLSDMAGEAAYDGDLNTGVAVGEYEVLQLHLSEMPQLGNIYSMEVIVYLKTGGSNTVWFGLHDGTDWVGSYGEASSAGMHVQLIQIGGEELRTWNTADYQVKVNGRLSASWTVAEIGVRIAYIPNRKPALPRRVAGGLMYDYWHVQVTSGPDYFLLPEFGMVPAALNRVMAKCCGQPDDGSGTYTGTADALIENPSDIIHHLLAEWSNLTSDDYVATGTGHGSLANMRTELGSDWMLSVNLNKRLPLREHILRICRQCRSMPIETAEGRFGVVAIESGPSEDYGHTWMPEEDFIKDTFKCGRTPVTELCTRVYVDFDYDWLEGRFRGCSFVTPDSSDRGNGYRDQSGTGEREDQAGYAEARFSHRREFRLPAYDVRHYMEAVALRNYYFDTLSKPRLWIQFQAGRQACDLALGHVIAIGTETVDGLLPPTPYGSALTWDDYTFYVQEVVRIDTRDSVPQYRVTAVEAMTADGAGDWDVVIP